MINSLLKLHRLPASDTDAPFTLQVTDSGTVTTTETPNVTVTHNEFPVLSYEAAYTVQEHSSTIILPTAFGFVL